ncbi:MAG: transposase [candidate division NC10 bacterium]
MLPLVEIPELVQHYAPFFAGVFSPAALEQFQRYLSGLIVSENKTVDGINRIFVVDTRNQSSLNRLLSESPFSVEALDQARLALLESLPGTQVKREGVISIDDTLLPHYGHHFDKIAKLFDPVSRAYVWAHNLVNLHYSDDTTDYPLAFQLWEPAQAETLAAGLKAAGVRLRAGKYALQQADPVKWRAYLVGVWTRHQQDPEVQKIYQSKLLIAQQRLADLFTQYPHLRPLPVTFDAWYTQAPFCCFLNDHLQVAYVGTLKGDAEVVLGTGKKRLETFADQLKEEHLQVLTKGQAPVFQPITIPYKGQKETYYSYCHTHRIKGFGRLRLVINHQQQDLSDTPRFFISNRLPWHAATLTRIRRHRWPVEVYHEEGKADGLAHYQVRNFEAIGKHIALVAVTYSLLRAAPHDPTLLRRLRQNVQTTLEGSAGSCRRNTQAQALWALACFIQTALAQGQTLKQAMHPLLTAVSA